MADDRALRDRIERLQTSLSAKRAKLSDTSALQAEVDAAVPSLRVELSRLETQVSALTKQAEAERFATLAHKRKRAEGDWRQQASVVGRALLTVGLLTAATAFAFAIAPSVLPDARVAFVAGLIGCGVCFRVGRQLR